VINSVKSIDAAGKELGKNFTRVETYGFTFIGWPERPQTNAPFWAGMVLALSLDREAHAP